MDSYWYRRSLAFDEEGLKSKCDACHGSVLIASTSEAARWELRAILTSKAPTTVIRSTVDILWVCSFFVGVRRMDAGSSIDHQQTYPFCRFEYVRPYSYFTGFLAESLA